MEFLGIGPLELLIILLIALVLLGPRDMAKAGRALGKFLRKIVTSPQWRVITQTSQELRNLPNRLIREAGLDEMQQDISNLRQTTNEIQDTLRSATILPPDWLGTKPSTSAQKNIPDSNQEIDSNLTKNESNPQVSEKTPTAQRETVPPLSDNLSAWTSAAGSETGSASDNLTDLSAWITPPPPPVKNSATKKQP